MKITELDKARELVFEDLSLLEVEDLYRIGEDLKRLFREWCDGEAKYYDREHVQGPAYSVNKITHFLELLETSYGHYIELQKAI